MATKIIVIDCDCKSEDEAPADPAPQDSSALSARILVTLTITLTVTVTCAIEFVFKEPADLPPVVQETPVELPPAPPWVEPTTSQPEEPRSVGCRRRRLRL